MRSSPCRHINLASGIKERRGFSRRRVLAGAGAAAAASWLPAAANSPTGNGRVLVVCELSGGNDGLNTVVPHGDDAYYRLRPTIGIRRDALLPLDDHFGFNPGLLGLQRLWRSGDLGVMHGCGYDNPSYSHFTSMAYWHTAAPHRGDAFGWLGRLADALDPTGHPNFLVNVGGAQSLAVASRLHAPVVFDDPERFRRDAFPAVREALAAIPTPRRHQSAAHRHLSEVARSAREGARLIREAWAAYRSPVDYGIAPMDLPKVAACIDAGLPARLYHVSFRNNAFDTHVQQAAQHRRLLSYAGDAIHGFVRDMERLGHGERVLLLAFSEFGRRVPENSNLGTDHGAANVMLLAGKPVRGGHYGERPDLAHLAEGDNLAATLDFRRVYATAMDWLAPGVAATVLKGPFPALPGALPG